MSSSIQASHWLTIAEVKWMQWCMLSRIETGLHLQLVVHDRPWILTTTRNQIEELDHALLPWSPVVLGDHVDMEQELQVRAVGGDEYHILKLICTSIFFNSVIFLSHAGFSGATN